MSQVLLGMDVGHKRIGIAIGNTDVAIAQPLLTLLNDEQVVHNLQTLLSEHSVDALVIGLPRGLDGQETAQTQAVQAFAEQLQTVITLPLHWQDEAVTSVQAEAELQARGKPFVKDAIDALAATYILQDYLDDYKRSHPA